MANLSFDLNVTEQHWDETLSRNRNAFIYVRIKELELCKILA